MIKATPLKIKRTGEWGAQVKSEVDMRLTQGDLVTITTRAGKSWNAEIDEVVWQSHRKTGSIVIFTTRQPQTQKTQPQTQQTQAQTQQTQAQTRQRYYGICTSCGDDGWSYSAQPHTCRCDDCRDLGY